MRAQQRMLFAYHPFILISPLPVNSVVPGASEMASGVLTLLREQSVPKHCVALLPGARMALWRRCSVILVLAVIEKAGSDFKDGVYEE